MQTCLFGALTEGAVVLSLLKCAQAHDIFNEIYFGLKTMGKL